MINVIVVRTDCIIIIITHIVHGGTQSPRSSHELWFLAKYIVRILSSSHKRQASSAHTIFQIMAFHIYIGTASNISQPTTRRALLGSQTRRCNARLADRFPKCNRRLPTMHARWSHNDEVPSAGAAWLRPIERVLYSLPLWPQSFKQLCSNDCN